ncbi:MAG: hypothetical protein JWR61_5219 [Ferruginibacter sp.]|uniref:hypothetical protein n=1 Tax=Ferruginibacter sp. TaxID=1940288 RepID=UPI00265A59F5|nr:hypothetical protein [Ferruginibacter sp.]MDB5280264.1 hypothetical protein [Ferruginibacter sp.]
MTLKQLIWRLILPLTIVLFGTITVLPVDAPDTMMVGFPLAYISDGWHTSMSLQIFIVEFLVDFVVYFFICFLSVFLVKHYLIKIKVSKLITALLWTFSTLIIAIAIWIASLPEQIIQTRRDWNMNVMETGYKLTWIHQDKQAFSKHDSSKK